MYLFILESIGTSELILIGIVALIVFGPRKLPQIARTIGKTMADFKKTTNEFKSTWEKEANFDDAEKNDTSPVNNSMPAFRPALIEDRQLNELNSISSPEIRELSSTEMEKILESKKNDKEQLIEPRENDKRSWL